MANNELASGTLGGMIAYLDQLRGRYRNEASKIIPLQSATRRVFRGVDIDEWQELDVREIDLDNVMSRFRQMTGANEFDDSTFSAYRSRINRAMRWYCQFLDDRDWTPFEETESVQKVFGDYSRTQNAADDFGTVKGVDMVTYPFPLSNGSMATLQLSKKLTRADAERLRMFIDSLVTER